MSDFEVNARPRAESGTAASRRLRCGKEIPAVVYGTGKENAMLVLDHDPFKHQLDIEAFHNSIIRLTSGGATEQVILREVQMHPYKPVVMHVDFQRISATDKIHMNVPLHFIGEDVAPGVRQEGGIVSHMMTEVDVNCLPADLPEYIEVDISGMRVGDSVHLSDLKLPAGVSFTHVPEGETDHAVVSVVMPKVAAEEEEEAGEEEAEAVRAAEPEEAGEEEA